MKLSLRNFTKILSPDLIKRAEQNTVRECDEISRGHFQAYVDERNDTYDTSLVFDNKGEITAHDCDCEGTSAFCRHRTALLLFIAKGGKVIVELNNSAAKNTKAAFSAEPTTRKMDYKPEEIQLITLVAVKEVVKTKRSLIIEEVKAIVDRWTILHDPIIEDYSMQPTDEAAFFRLHAVLETCEQERQRLITTSVRFVSYQQKVFSSLLPYLNHIKDEEYWDQAVGYFIGQILGPNNEVRLHYVSFLYQLIQLSSTERKTRLSTALIDQYETVYLSKEFDKERKYTIVMLNIVVEGGIFDEYGCLFQTLSSQYDYNILLIKSLIAHNNLDWAEYCVLNVIDAEYGYYSFEDYLGMLKEIYTLKKDTKRLSTIMKHTVRHTFDFKAYLNVRKNMDDQERLEWREYMFARSRASVYSSLNAADFSFRLLGHEKKYSQMIDQLDHAATYDIIDEYVHKLASTDSMRLFKQLIARTENTRKKLSKRQIDDLNPLFERILRILQYSLKLEDMVAVFKEFQNKYRSSDPSWFVLYVGKQFKSL